MIDFNELEKVSEYKNGELNWFEGRDINAVYVILVGDEYYIGSSHYVYLRIGQHLSHLLNGRHHSDKFQKKFDEVKEFEVYSLDRGIERYRLQTVEEEYIRKYKPTLNIITSDIPNKLRIKELIKEKGYTQKEFAEKLGMSTVGLSQLINGKPSFPTLEKFANALNVPIWQLFVSEEEICKKDIIICPKCGTKFKMEADD